MFTAGYEMLSLRWLLIGLNVVATLGAVWMLRKADGVASILFALLVLIYTLLNLLHVVLVHRGERTMRSDGV